MGGTTGTVFNGTTGAITAKGKLTGNFALSTSSSEITTVLPEAGADGGGFISLSTATNIINIGDIFCVAKIDDSSTDGTWTKASGFTILIPFSRFAFAVHTTASASSIALRYKAGEHDVSTTVSSASAAGTSHANGQGTTTMPGAPADTGEALAKISTNMSLTIGAKYNISAFCNSIYNYGTQDGYTTAGSKVELDNDAKTITVPTSYNSGGGGYIDPSSRWGTTDYTLTLTPNAGSSTVGTIEAKLTGTKGTISISNQIWSTIPAKDSSNNWTYDLKAGTGSGTVVATRSAQNVYTAGWNDGWDEAVKQMDAVYLYATGGYYVYGPSNVNRGTQKHYWTYTPDNLAAAIGNCTLPTDTYYKLIDGPISAAYYYGDGKGSDAIVSYNGSSWKAYRSASSWYTVSGVTVYTGHTQATPYLTGDHSSFG